ncbi:MAG: M48 family peptidase, partial [Verrucomicrobiota bacterium]|nr:M48 family peptidase [Verrucomicrobiota bacterium]
MVLFITALLIVLRLAAELWLNALNRREVCRRATARPPAVAAIMDEPTYAKAVDYTLAKNRFARLEMVFGAGVLAAAIFSGLLPWLFARMDVWAPGAAWNGALIIFLASLLVGLPGLPFEWWEQFRLEGKFGFNKSTLRLWLADKIKGLLLALAIGFPLLWA